MCVCVQVCLSVGLSVCVCRCVCLCIVHVVEPSATQDSDSLTVELESSLKQCQEFITELLQRTEVWPFRRPLSRKEVRTPNIDIFRLKLANSSDFFGISYTEISSGCVTRNAQTNFLINY